MRRRERCRFAFKIPFGLGKKWKSLISTIKEEDEKVALKFSNDELVMTRFSTPKSIMRFNKNEDGGAIIPTPMGIQQFLITTDLFQLEEGRLQVTYRLLTLDGEQEFANYQLLVEWAE